MGCSMASQQVHPTAIVHANAQIGKDVEIGPYAIIEEHVVIGDRCRIDAHAVIKDYTRMGVGNHIHSHALVGGEPQDLKFQGEVTWLELGDDNRIREFATLHRGTEGGGGITRIGSRNLCMAPILWDCAAPGLPARRSPLSNRPSASFGAVRCPALKPWICLRTTTQICLK